MKTYLLSYNIAKKDLPNKESIEHYIGTHFFNPIEILPQTYLVNCCDLMSSLYIVENISKKYLLSKDSQVFVTDISGSEVCYRIKKKANEKIFKYLLEENF